MTPRSWLFCPGNRPDRLTKAVGLADIVIADLEDAITMREKPAARAAVAAWLHANPHDANRVWVRVNGDPENLSADLAVVGGCAGIVVPKAELDTVTGIAARCTLPLLALVETATGLWQLRELALVDQVHVVSLGEYDLAADLGTSSPDVDGSPMHYARAQVVAASAAAGIAPPPAPVSAALDDPDAFRADTEALLRHGFFGRMCVHPSQVAQTHAAMAPTEDEVTKARALVAAAEQAEHAGTGVLVVAGAMIDAPIVRRARRVLELAELP